MTHGLNFKRLVAHKMAFDAIPEGGGFDDGLEFLSDPGKLTRSAREAQAWVGRAVRLVMEAPSNPHGSDEEAICAEILKRIEERGKGR